MAESGFNAALRKKLAGTGAGAARAALRPDGLSAALTRALRKAAAPYEGLMATPDEINGLYDVSGVNHIFKIHRAYAEKAPIGARVLPCANN